MRLLVAIALACLLVAGAARAALPQPAVGPLTATIGPEARLDIPEGFFWFNEAAAKTLLLRDGNLPGDGVRGLVTYPGASWYAVLQEAPIGHLGAAAAETARLDPDALIAAIRRLTGTGNGARVAAGMPPIEVTGWQGAPVFDAARQRLVWGVAHRVGGREEVNLQNVVLGRRGYVTLDLVTDLASLPRDRRSADALLAGLAFEPGARYQDFDPATDRLAPIGVAQLIAPVGAAPSDGRPPSSLVLPVFLMGIGGCLSAAAVQVRRKRLAAAA